MNNFVINQISKQKHKMFMFDTIKYVLQNIDAMKLNKFTLNVLVILSLNQITCN